MAKKDKQNRNKRQNRADANFKAKDLNVEFASEMTKDKTKNFDKRTDNGGGC